MSLRQKLNDYIKDKGEISYYELQGLCNQWHFKVATAERELRPSKSPDIENIMKGKAIIGYKYKQNENVKDFLEKWPSIVKEKSVLF